MAEIVVSAVVGVVIEKLISGALMKFARSEGIESQLNEWKKTLPLIQALLADAAQKQTTQKAVELWLIDLQELAYDIEDVVDDIAIEVMKRDFKKSQASSSTSGKLFNMLPTCCTSYTPHSIMYGRKMSSTMDKLTSKMHNLFNLKRDLGLVENEKVGISNKTDVRFNQTSLVDESKVLGREDDKAVLMEKLLGGEESSNRNVSIVSIVGMGGIGKTTLARLLYNDQKVKDHFEVRSWVCVSDDFDVFGISKQIYQDVCGKNNDFSNLNQLQVALQKELSKKRFLLVLDDVWNENHQNWELLERPLLVGASGSKIIVTTRKTKVASVMNSVQHHNLGVLSDEIALSLFAQYAVDEQNFDEHKSLVSIARGIVKKCDGLPLGLITLGRVLKTKGTKEEWEELLNSEIWDLHDESDILPALKLSYFDLPAHLKQVFAYSSLFPKDYEFEKDKIVLLWMAQGFLSQTKGKNQPMESLGREYFEELLSRSFFQPSTNQKSRYIMHDLINDLAISVAGEFFFLLDDNKDSNNRNQAFERFRYFSFIGQQGAEYKKFKELHKARCLRTFLTVSVGWRKFDTLNNVIVKLLPQLHLLRVLSLTNWSITEVPQSIGNLKHLRYLNFSNTNIKRIPEEVGELYNLQTFLVSGCFNLSSLPVSFVKLIQLRHLDIINTPSLKKMPFGIGRFTSLQTLSKVVIHEDIGFKISELEALSDLQGVLSIEGLHKVIEPAEAMEANLEQKKGLDDLQLVWNFFWDDSRDPVTEYQVLENLRPPSKLKTLCISGYGGMKFPSWLGDPSFDQLTKLEHLTSLEKLEVSECPKLVSIKGVGSSIMPSLRQVKIEKCDSLESYCCPNSVEKLEVSECPKLVSIKGVGSSIMPSLRQVKIEKCDSLESYCCPNSVEKLEVSECPKLVSIKGVGSSIMPSLRQVKIEKCDSLESYCCPNSVENLKVWSCSNLVSIKGGEKDVGSSIMPSLTHVILWNCDSLESFCCPISVEKLDTTLCSKLVSIKGVGSSIMPSLRHVSIRNCGKLLLESYCCPNNVEKLEIVGCSSITSLSFSKLQEEEDLPSSSSSNLKSLGIINCKNIKTISEEHIESLASLEEMGIRRCPKIEDSFPSSGLLRGLQNLRKLEIGEMKKPMSEWGLQYYPSSLVELDLYGKNSGVVSFGIMEQQQHHMMNTPSTCFLLPPSLTSLSVHDFEEVESLSEVLPHLPHLQVLFIDNCPKLRDVPQSTSLSVYVSK